MTESFYTLFQIMTFDSWSSGIVRPILQIDPYAWVIFISFLLIASYIVLNIAIGIIVDCITEIKEYEMHLKIQEKEDKLFEKINLLENEIKELKDIIQKNYSKQ
ncbi:ion transporter [Rodentibacter ratti]|uniref:ion transporter n=1 Tax=Rodentibacter ratti TaxID=1906745 RepID=UPI003CC6CF87